MIAVGRISLIFLCCKLFTQEFNATLEINISQLPGVDQSIFEELKTQLLNLINTTRWTNLNIKEEERIQIGIFFNINTTMGGNKYGGFLQLSYSRPIYGSSYLSPVITIKDENLTFTYIKGQPIIFSEFEHDPNNIASIIGYYIYLILGICFDTYSMYGGDDYYQKANQIVINAQNSGDIGWIPSDKKRRNRYWIINTILDPEFKKFRRFLYEYHRKGLDSMHINPEKSVDIILKSLQILYEAYVARPNNILFQFLFEAKNDEITKIFSPCNSEIRRQFLQLVEAMDPAHITKYRQKSE